jgi:hypothetical protein
LNGSKSSKKQKKIFKVPTLDQIDEQRDQNNESVKNNLKETLKDAKKIQKELDELNKRILEKKEISWQDKKKVQDLINQQQTRDYIINALSRDYNITMEEATQKFDGVLSMYRANEEMNRSTNRIFRIKNNPGFPIEIIKKERIIDVEISNINNIQYVYFLSIFINNLILLSQNVIKDDNIKQFCDVKEVKIVDIEYEREIDAPIEFTENTLDFRIKPGDMIFYHCLAIRLPGFFWT